MTDNDSAIREYPDPLPSDPLERGILDSTIDEFWRSPARLGLAAALLLAASGWLLPGYRPLLALAAVVAGIAVVCLIVAFILRTATAVAPPVSVLRRVVRFVATHQVPTGGALPRDRER